MSLFLQNLLIAAVLLAACLYLAILFVRSRQKPKCRDCGVFRALDASSKGRPFPPAGKD